MSAVDAVFPRVATDEGFRARPYKDTRGNITLGYGFNVNAGITKYAAAALAKAQLEEADRALGIYQWYRELDTARQGVCLEIAFNDGISGLLHFPRMIAALSVKDWKTAAAECHVQEPELASRYAMLAHILLAGAPQL